MYKGELLYGVQYSRDRLGRISEKTESLAGETTAYAYTYDMAGRIKEVQRNGTTVAMYTYDANGNRLSYTGIMGVDSADYDRQDRLTRYGATTYSYSASGDLESKTEETDTTSYSYDEFGNLLAVVLPNGNCVEYLIDGRNRRIGKKVNGVLTQGFLYQDPLNPIAELDSNGNLITRFVYGSHLNAPDYMIKGGTTYRIISDQTGSPRLVVNALTGEVAQRIDYDVFGKILLDTNPGFQPFGFAGGLHDPDTGLVRFGYRDYDPDTGRWTAKDPILFRGGDTNLYGYVLGDPVNWVDPSGLQRPVRDPSDIVNAGPLVGGGSRSSVGKSIPSIRTP